MNVIVKLLVLLLVACNVAATTIPELKTVGQGSFRYLFWQLYDARLASATGEYNGYQQSTPLLLELTYKRDISKADFVSATIEQLQNIGNSDDTQHHSWQLQLQQIWHDVKKGDRLSALLTETGEVSFYFNGSYTGSVTDAQFGQAFFDIWLHPKTSAPELRRQLTAQ